MLFDMRNAATSGGIDRTVMLRLLTDQGLEMLVRVTVRERTVPTSLAEFWQTALRIQSSYAA